MNLKKVALNLLRDELVLELERGVFNEAVPKMVIYVPDTQAGQDPTGIFVSDDRNPDDPRVIVAQQYFVMTDPKSNQIALRLVDGVIHSRPDNVEQYSKVSFSTYDLKMNFNENLYGSDERSSVETILAKLDQSGWKDTAALRRLMEHYKDWPFRPHPWCSVYWASRWGSSPNDRDAWVALRSASSWWSSTMS